MAQTAMRRCIAAETSAGGTLRVRGASAGIEQSTDTMAVGALRDDERAGAQRPQIPHNLLARDHRKRVLDQDHV